MNFNLRLHGAGKDGCPTSIRAFMAHPRSIRFVSPQEPSASTSGRKCDECIHVLLLWTISFIFSYCKLISNHCLFPSFQISMFFFLLNKGLSTRDKFYYVQPLRGFHISLAYSPHLYGPRCYRPVKKCVSAINKRVKTKSNSFS